MSMKKGGRKCCTWGNCKNSSVNTHEFRFNTTIGGFAAPFLWGVGDQFGSKIRLRSVEWQQVNWFDLLLKMVVSFLKMADICFSLWFNNVWLEQSNLWMSLNLTRYLARSRPQATDWFNLILSWSSPNRRLHILAVGKRGDCFFVCGSSQWQWRGGY